MFYHKLDKRVWDQRLGSFRMYKSHWISYDVWVGARYSAWDEEREIKVCFFNFQEIRETPMKILKWVMDFLESRQVAQPLSLRATSCKWETE